MNARDLSTLTDNELRALIEACSNLIKSHRACLGEFELYVRCQYELACRSALIPHRRTVFAEHEIGQGRAGDKRQET